MLDRTEQRILGVLIEKEATVKDIYPLTENALRAGCNQLNNREPVMDLQPFQIAGTLMSLLEKGWVSRLDGSGRATKYKHKVVERLSLQPDELAVLCELLLRGPQAPGALKPRVARLGYVDEAAGIEACLQRMASRPKALVSQLPLGPRERERKWQHLLSDGSSAANEPAPQGPTPSAARSEDAVVLVEGGDRDLAARVAALELQVEELKKAVRELTRMQP